MKDQTKTSWAGLLPAWALGGNAVAGGDEASVVLTEPSVLGLVAAGVVVSILVLRGRR